MSSAFRNDRAREKSLVDFYRFANDEASEYLRRWDRIGDAVNAVTVALGRPPETDAEWVAWATSLGMFGYEIWTQGLGHALEDFHPAAEGVGPNSPATLGRTATRWAVNLVRAAVGGPSDLQAAAADFRACVALRPEALPAVLAVIADPVYNAVVGALRDDWRCHIAERFSAELSHLGLSADEAYTEAGGRLHWRAKPWLKDLRTRPPILSLDESDDRPDAIAVEAPPPGLTLVVRDESGISAPVPPPPVAGQPTSPPVKLTQAESEFVQALREAGEALQSPDLAAKIGKSVEAVRKTAGPLIRTKKVVRNTVGYGYWLAEWEGTKADPTRL